MISRRLGGDVSAELASKELSNNVCAILIHFVDAGATVDLSDLVQLGVVLDNWHSGLLVNVFGGYQSFWRTQSGGESLTESFLDAFFVIILSATGLTSLQKSFQHNFLCRGVE
jgi:hypothetical protein